MPKEKEKKTEEKTEDVKKTSDSGTPPLNQPGKRPQIAVVVWLLIFVGMGILFVFTQTRKEITVWTQSKFESELREGNVQTVESTPLTEKVQLLEGKYKYTPEGGEEPATRNYQVKVELTDRLDQLLSDCKVERATKPKSQWIGILITTLLPILIIIGVLYFLFSRQMKIAGRGAMQFGKSRARMLLPDTQKITFNDVAGAEEAKEETRELVDYLKDPLKFKMLGAKIPKGALLMGPPGTGKTLLAKAISGEAKVPFFTISGSDFVEMFVGVGASRVRDMFEQAKQHAPCLIFIDEIDAVGRSRFSGIGGGHDEREQTLNALLVEMDGMETQEGVIILAATNRPDVLDPALTRPGRLDRQIMLDLPDIKGRKEILEVHAKNIKLSDDVDLDIISRGTPGFSGADLANLINEAALLAARQDKKEAEMVDLEEARDKVRWGRERKSRKISEEERRITAYHEAGHTLVALRCPKATPVHKVTIIPRGMAYLGATMSLPQEDRYIRSMTDFLDEIAVLMGGRCAEELVFKEITSGASSDIQQATTVARGMVCSFGMSSRMGTVQYGSRGEHIYLGRDITKTDDYSEETGREIDLEIKRIIDEAHSRAAAILKKEKANLETLADTLLKKEVMDIKEIKKLLNIEDPDPERPNDGQGKQNLEDTPKTAKKPRASTCK
ncbi:MAG: ATP-dependent zinc metalloprotease FtsH [Victivallales bacterium]|nr:ATP-dependent zinc metalloprotease FtsH [Victivallales bacterium]